MRLIIIVLGIFAIGVMFYVFAEDYQRDRLFGIISYQTPERKCFNFFRDDLRDPGTAYLHKSIVWTKNNELNLSSGNPDKIFYRYESVIKVMVKAKNTYGSYGDVVFVCPLVDGRFREINAQVHGYVLQD